MGLQSLSGNLHFDNKALRNHWVAGFFKDQLQPEMWDLLTAREIEKDSIEATKVDAEVKKREEQFEQIKMAGIDETVTAKPLTPHIAARKGANHTQKIDMNGASTKYKTKHAKHPTPPLQNRSPSNLLPSKHDTTMPKMASTKSLPSKMVSFKMHFFKKIRCSILYFVDKVGVWTGDPALAREVSAPHYFVEKMITGIIILYSIFYIIYILL